MSMTDAIQPKSDQLNADDMIGGPQTITITSVEFSGGTEQPVSMFFEGSKKAYRPCKSMCRVLVNVWGPDAKKYVGRSLILYRDPDVKWGGMAVGGIRISHMTDMESAQTMALTETKGKRKPFTVKPLQVAKPVAGPEPAKKHDAHEDGRGFSDYDSELSACMTADDVTSLYKAYTASKARLQAEDGAMYESLRQKMMKQGTAFRAAEKEST